MWESLKNVPLKKRVIVRTNLFEFILEITLFLSAAFFRESGNLYPRRGRGSLFVRESATAGSESGDDLFRHVGGASRCITVYKNYI